MSQNDLIIQNALLRDGKKVNIEIEEGIIKKIYYAAQQLIKEQQLPV